ncbi:MAG: hypothetical protein ABIO70_11910 [Pseudomonadota bacterium]
MLDSPWTAALDALRAWHTHRDHASARRAIAFLEPELRLAVPALVQRTWPPELVKDTLREFLAALLEAPLPATIEHPERYLVRAFRNRCIDVHRARQRRREVPLEPFHMPEDAAAPSQTAEDELLRRARAMRVSQALSRLSMADRVALELVDAPEWLTEAEMRWLAARGHGDVALVRHAVQQARNIHALTLIFDPPQADEPGDRRQRMERFRRRRARAREKLRDLLTGGEES